MSFLLAAAGWFIAGNRWFTNILAAVSIGSLAAFGGYVAGRIHGSQAAALAEMEAQRDYYAAEIKRREAVDVLARTLADDMSRIETENVPITSEIDAQIDSAPVVANCVSPGFLDGLRRLK